MPYHLINGIAWWMVAITLLLAGAAKAYSVVYGEVADNFRRHHKLGNYAQPLKDDEERTIPENVTDKLWSLTLRERISRKLAGVFASGFGMAITVIIVVAFVTWLN